MRALRLVAFLVGSALLSATAHVTIAASGGYGAPGAILTLAIALGVAVASLAIGGASTQGRGALVVWLAAAILAGEAFGLLATAERLVASRETVQAPLRDAQTARSAAAQRVENAERAKTDVDAAVFAKSADRGCAANCRALLQAQVDSAQRELEAARVALSGLQMPPLATPLADRLGLAPWALDLIAAALGSMAANGLGIGLIAFGGHGHGRPGGAAEDALPAAVIMPRPISDLREHAAQFAVEALKPAKGRNTDLSSVYEAYRAWCEEEQVVPLSVAQIGAELAALFRGAGSTIAEGQGRRVVHGVTVKAAPKRKALGRMSPAVVSG